MKHAPILKVPILTLLLSAGIAASAAAQNHSQAPTQPTASSTAPSGTHRSVTLQEPSGPVTVTWGQSQTLPNAADYQTKVPDLDRNGDGVLSRAEVPPDHALSSEFKLVDRNHDGKITAAELQNWR
ncbi:hypothetical protein [Pseudoxanthomonas sp. UTMC 1351]|uniref:hypothetical protein n=1 Tax=Pseudoxanthomonas sp. UTMC 1351 TaxID=2695853 RepID=UPI0034CD1B6A